MYIKQYADFDKSIINKAKDYAEKRDLQYLTGMIEVFEEEQDLNHKKEIYEAITESIKYIEDVDQRIAQRRLARIAKQDVQSIIS